MVWLHSEYATYLVIHKYISITNFWFVTLKYYLVMCDPVLIIIIIIDIIIWHLSFLYPSLRDKPLYGQILWEITDKICIKSQWLWLRKGNFTKVMGGLVFAAQEQALSTNSIKTHIYKMPCSPKCRLCGVADEAVDHLISSCSFSSMWI